MIVRNGHRRARTEGGATPEPEGNMGLPGGCGEGKELGWQGTAGG